MKIQIPRLLPPPTNWTLSERLSDPEKIRDRLALNKATIDVLQSNMKQSDKILLLGRGISLGGAVTTGLALTSRACTTRSVGGALLGASMLLGGFYIAVAANETYERDAIASMFVESENRILGQVESQSNTLW